MPAEATQEQGRRGVETIKRWLEATTFIELLWNAYENSPYCSLELLNGEVKSWDLAGSFLTGRARKSSSRTRIYRRRAINLTNLRSF